MVIKSNLGTGVLPVGLLDTVIFNPSVSIDRYVVTACSLHNETLSNITVSVYVGPDQASATAELVDQIVLHAGQTKDSNYLIGNGYNKDNIIMVATAEGVNASLTRTEYSEGS